MSDYHINIWHSDERQGYVADIPDLEGCNGFGTTPSEALGRLEKAKAAWLEAATADGRPIPPPQYRPALFEPGSFYDPLTGLPTRRQLLERVSDVMAQPFGSREGFALLFLDIDRFRVVDSALGHAAGNELLRRIALRIHDCVRPQDTVARVGGDEFGVLSPYTARMEDAVEIAQKVMDAIKRPFVVANREVFVTASVGISLFPRDGEDAETLLNNATAAAYVAKERGQDTFRRYTARISARDVERLNIETGLRRALEQGGLVLHYQPMVDLRTGRVERMEALIRWDRPGVGLVGAPSFIPVAEASGIVVAIDSWVIRTACAEAKAWQDRGHPYGVAVNLSARQFQQPDLVDLVGQVLGATGLPVGSLEIEITESSAMVDLDKSVETLRALRALGVSVSVDDFGTGYSSLSYLRRLPVDTVKLDESFVRDLTSSSDDAAIATAVIAMAHGLKLRVVAEGVEDEDQLAFLRRQGCDAIQGRLFSRPLPADELVALLTEGRGLPVAAD
jgi:diguanylate cyclase (GGDEF)-like protein